MTGAALQGADIGTTLLLFCYAAGAAASLALALLVGGKVSAVMKRSLGLGPARSRCCGSRWADKCKDRGLVVIGIHAPEFAFETSIDNVKRAVPI